MLHKETQLHHIFPITVSTPIRISALSDLQANKDEELVGKQTPLTVKGGERASF